MKENPFCSLFSCSHSPTNGTEVRAQSIDKEERRGQEKFIQSKKNLVAEYQNSQFVVQMQAEKDKKLEECSLFISSNPLRLISMMKNIPAQQQFNQIVSASGWCFQLQSKKTRLKPLLFLAFYHKLPMVWAWCLVNQKSKTGLFKTIRNEL